MSAVTATTRLLVLDRSLNAQGEIECAYCTQPITLEQKPSLQHIVPRQSMHTYTTQALCDALNVPPRERQLLPRLNAESAQMLVNRYLNHPDNLCAMHNACHAEADHGVHVPLAEQAAYNYYRQPMSAEALSMALLNTHDPASVIQPVIMPLARRSLALIREYLPSFSPPQQAEVHERIARAEQVLSQRLQAAAALFPVIYDRQLHVPGRLVITKREGIQLAKKLEQQPLKLLDDFLRGADYGVLKECQFYFSDKLQHYRAQSALLAGDEARPSAKHRRITRVIDALEPRLDHVQRVVHAREQASRRACLAP